MGALMLWVYVVMVSQEAWVYARVGLEVMDYRIR